MSHSNLLTMHKGLLFLAWSYCLLTFNLPAGADEPLQGHIEDSRQDAKLNGGSMKDNMEAKLDQMELQSGTQGLGFNGNVQGAGQNLSLKGTAGAGPGSGSGPMHLGASNDPDGNNQELQIGWDRWRNTLTQAIQAGTINKINVHNDTNFVYDQHKHMMLSRYPQGISTQYSCDVLPDGRIINIRLIQSSGYQTYDQCVMQSIMELQGNPILRYPYGSLRQIVNQQASVITASENHFQNFHFGDVENQRR